MATYREMPFPAVLAALFGGDEVPVHLVFRLSDMPADDFAQFRRDWTEVSEERRAALVRHMADIAEENYLVDFTPVFAYLFDDSYPAVRRAALDGVWDSTDTQLIPPIMAMLRDDANVGVRAAAARALAHYVLLAEWGQIKPGAASPVELLAGGGGTAAENVLGCPSPAVMAAAALMGAEVVRLLAGRAPALSGKALVADLETMRFDTVTF